MKFFKISVLLIFMIGYSATISAQLLKIVVKDKSLRENAMLMSPSGLKMLEFDDTGIYEYDDPNLKGKHIGSLMLGTLGTWTLIIEKSRSLVVNCSIKKGQPNISFQGVNAEETLFDNDFRHFILVDDIQDENAQMRTLSNRYIDLSKRISKKKDINEKQRLLRELDNRYLQARINTRLATCRKQGIAVGNDTVMLNLLSQINVNDPNDKYSALSKFYIDVLTPVKPGKDMTDYYISYLETIDKYVSNPIVNYQKKDFAVLNAVGNPQPVDYNRLWPEVKRLCDSTIVNRYQYIIDTHGKSYEGTTCPDFELADTKGIIHHLSEYRGKYVFIDIWATWCGPCCREIPYVAEHAKHYKDDNRIQFISISCDDTEGPWLRKLEQDKPDWPQYYTDKSRYQKISHHFGIKSIPRFLLIGPDGMVITTEAPRPSHDDFYEQLEKLM